MGRSVLLPNTRLKLTALAWALGVLTLLTSLAPLSRFNQLTLVERTTAVWLLCTGSALIIAGRGLRHRHTYAAWTAVIVCGLWLAIRIPAFIRQIVDGGTWTGTTWIILISQSVWLLVILGIVLAQRDAFSGGPRE